MLIFIFEKVEAQTSHTDNCSYLNMNLRRSPFEELLNWMDGMFVCLSKPVEDILWGWTSWIRTNKDWGLNPYLSEEADWVCCRQEMTSHNGLMSPSSMSHVFSFNTTIICYMNSKQQQTTQFLQYLCHHFNSFFLFYFAIFTKFFLFSLLVVDEQQKPCATAAT